MGQLAPSSSERQTRVQGAGLQNPLVPYAWPAVPPSKAISHPSPPWGLFQPGLVAPAVVWMPLSCSAPSSSLAAWVGFGDQVVEQGGLDAPRVQRTQVTPSSVEQNRPPSLPQ